MESGGGGGGGLGVVVAAGQDKGRELNAKLFHITMSEERRPSLLAPQPGHGTGIEPLFEASINAWFISRQTG